MNPQELVQQAQWVIWVGLFIGVVLGAISQASRFCTLGAVADWVGTGDRSRMRMWVLAMATALLSTQLLIALTGFESQQTVYTSNRLLWLSNILGGLVFG
ncbi:MAG: YeeE/YedE thiosulfate transporter family protein, partial [Burkholderiaceae bacterium]